MATLKDYYGSILRDVVNAHDVDAVNRIKGRVATKKAAAQAKSLKDMLDSDQAGFNQSIGIAGKSTITASISAQGTEKIGGNGSASGGVAGVIQVSVGGSYERSTGEADTVTVVTDLSYTDTDSYMSQLAEKLGIPVFPPTPNTDPAGGAAPPAPNAPSNASTKQS